MWPLTLSKRGRKARGHLSWRCSLLFVLPSHHTHRTFSKSLPNKPTASSTPVAIKPYVYPLPKSLQAQSHRHNIPNPITTPRTDFESLRHSLSTQGTYSATEFSRPPVQLAGFLSIPQPGQIAHSALPILDLAVTHYLHLIKTAAPCGAVVHHSL